MQAEDSPIKGRKMKDVAFGELAYEYYEWIGVCRINFFGMPRDVRLSIFCDEGEDIEKEQREAFLGFEGKKNALVLQAEKEIFLYYSAICQDLRNQFGKEFADKWAPLITEEKQLASLLVPVGVNVPQSLDSEERVVGVLFDCSWAPELGLAVKFVNEEIRDIGPQNIVA